MGGTNVSEATRAHRYYLELSEGISEKKTLCQLCCQPQPKFESLHQPFGKSEVSIDKLLRRIGTIKNANQLESFIATLGGINAGRRAKASICVQSTTICRKTYGGTRGSKRLASRRPAMGTKRASKLPRNVANMINHNTKSRGSGH
jgi:hypothetical protein